MRNNQPGIPNAFIRFRPLNILILFSLFIPERQSILVLQSHEWGYFQSFPRQY